MNLRVKLYKDSSRITKTTEYLQTLGDFILDHPNFLTEPEQYLTDEVIITQPFHEFVENNPTLIANTNGELTLLENICCGYVDKEIYLRYETADYVQKHNNKDFYNQPRWYQKMLCNKGFPINERIEKYYLYKDNTQPNTFIYCVKRSKESLEEFGYIKINIKIESIVHNKLNFSEARELWLLFLQQCYGYSYTEDYNKISKNELYVSEDIIKRPEIEHVGDSARYKLSNLMNKYDTSLLNTNKPWLYKRFLYQYAVMLNIVNKNYPKNWTKGSIEEILSGKHFFCKYKEGPVALVFKDRWL